MAKERQPRGGQEDVAPHDLPEMPPPRHVHPGHDFTLQAVMEMQRTLGQFTAKIERLIEDVGRLSTKIGEVEKAVERVKTGAVVAGAILSIVGIVFWWAIGDRITAAMHNAIMGNLPPAAQAPPPPQK